MHSSLNRAQAVFGFFTTVALFVAGVAALSVLLYPADDAKAQVALKDVKVYVLRVNCDLDSCPRGYLATLGRPSTGMTD